MLQQPILNGYYSLKTVFSSYEGTGDNMLIKITNYTVTNIFNEIFLYKGRWEGLYSVKLY